ncbi:MAG: hypothetical protein HKN58_05515 [Xanthomonadales bacterium]|nr:hypothetical protein [Xanthomonadales bacterium]
MPKVLPLCSALLLLNFAAPDALADASLIYAGEQPMRIDVSDGVVRMSQGDGGEAIIYNTKTGTLLQLDPRSKSYMKIDDELMNKMGDQMAQMRKQMEAQLANLPAEQREALMANLPGVGPATEKRSAPKPSFSGETGKYGGVKCRVATAEINGATESMCLADAKGLGISGGDFKTILAMFSAMQDMAAQFSNEDAGPDLASVGAIPVYNTGDESSTLEKVLTDDLEPALFAPPADYQPRSMPGM